MTARAFFQVRRECNTSQLKCFVDVFLNRMLQFVFFFQAEDGIRDPLVTGVQTCALPISKRRERAVTFDDLLIMVRDLLRDQPGVADRYRNELRAILVDEYQDTNAVQDEIIALLTEPRPGAAPPAELFIVGDEKQSIYRFRGADVRVFRRVRSSTPATLPLAENRRSTPNILNFVNGLSASAMAADETVPAAAYLVVWEAAHALTPARSTIADYPVEIIP